MKFKAHRNVDFDIKENERPYCVEIERIFKEDSETDSFEYFKTEKQAEKRIIEINK